MRFLIVALTLLFAAPAFAQQCRNGTCSVPSRAYMSYAPTTHTAQGVAERMAMDNSCRHYGNPTGGYEGVGMGSSPEDALNRCCYSRSGMRVVDQGVACGRNGRWYACKRYR